MKIVKFGYENFAEVKVNVAHLSINHIYFVTLKGWCSENGNVMLLQDACFALIGNIILASF